MADPTTILDYAQQRRDNAKLAVAAAQQLLAQAQSSVAAKSDELAKATDDFADLIRQADEIRKKLASVPTPADGDALLDALEQLIIRSRTQRAVILKAQADLDAARADGESAQSLLNADSARLAAAESQAQEAGQSSKRRDKLKAALGAAPLSTISADAAEALTKAPFTDAKTRIEADIPAKLLTRADERLAAEAARIAKTVSDAQAAEDAALDERDENGGAAGQAESQWAAFLRAEAAAQDFVSSAQSRFDGAQAALARVADVKQSPLTPEQAARINDATLKAAREAAVDAEKARDGKLRDLLSAGDALEAEILKAIADNENPDDVQAVQDARADLTAAEAAFKTADDAWRAKEKDRDAALADVEAKQAALAKAIQAAVAAKKNPDTDPDVGVAKTDLTNAQITLKTAENTYRQSDHGILHAWEAAVPDTTWQLLADYEAARRTLDELIASDSAKLVGDLETAEEDYVKARLKADASANVIEQLGAERTRRAGRRGSALQNESHRLLSALRGDN
jgi:hypothetical protein